MTMPAAMYGDGGRGPISRRRTRNEAHLLKHYVKHDCSVRMWNTTWDRTWRSSISFTRVS